MRARIKEKAERTAERLAGEGLTPANALEKRRLEMLGWLVRDGWLDVKVGLMRQGSARAAQIEAARLRLVDELGRMLICFPPDAEDMNTKFHRLATERSLTAERLQRAFARLGAYPDWDEFRMEELRDYRAVLGPSQVKTRLTGSEVDAALADPRWGFA